MKYLSKKIIAMAFVALSSIASFSSSANIIHLTQELLLNGQAQGFVIIDANSVDEFNEVTEFLEFELFGFAIETDPALFVAAVDEDSLFNGLAFLQFDASFFNIAFQGIFDAFEIDPSFNTVDIFNTNNDNILFFGELSLGQVTVPAPSALGLLLVAFAAFTLRQRAQK